MPDSFYAEFGRRMARRRSILRLKQREVGAAIGVHPSHVSALEHGRQRMMYLHQMQALARILETSSDYLLQLTDADPGTIPDRRSPAEQHAMHSTTALPVTPSLERIEANV
jgi:transcriptional regulator with XRE-family HTH domain